MNQVQTKSCPVCESKFDAIEVVRRQLVDVALEKGFVHYDTVQLSQYLDRLLNQFDCQSGCNCL